MAQVPLRNRDGVVAAFTVVDQQDLASVSRWRWSRGGSRGQYAYRKGPGRKNIYLHRFLLDAPCGYEVDHINGDTLDNRRDNLRLATPCENKFNTGLTARNRSGFKGVHWNAWTKSWDACIRVNHGIFRLGHYANPAEAAEVYQQAAEFLHGQFARTA